MKETHTRGPWKIGLRADSKAMIYGPLGEEVADCDRFFNTPDQNSANARLIAAAPDLLDALKTTLSHAEDMLVELEDQADLSDYPYIVKARAAIAMAEDNKERILK